MNGMGGMQPQQMQPGQVGQVMLSQPNGQMMAMGPGGMMQCQQPMQGMPQCITCGGGSMTMPNLPTAHAAPMGAGAMGAGAMGNGAMGNGAMGNGAMGNGAMGNGAMGNGALGNSVAVADGCCNGGGCCNGVTASTHPQRGACANGMATNGMTTNGMQPMIQAGQVLPMAGQAQLSGQPMAGQPMPMAGQVPMSSVPIVRPLDGNIQSGCAPQAMGSSPQLTATVASATPPVVQGTCTTAQAPTEVNATNVTATNVTATAMVVSSNPMQQGGKARVNPNNAPVTMANGMVLPSNPACNPACNPMMQQLPTMPPQMMVGLAGLRIPRRCFKCLLLSVAPFPVSPLRSRA